MTEMQQNSASNLYLSRSHHFNLFIRSFFVTSCRALQATLIVYVPAIWCWISRKVSDLGVHVQQAAYSKVPMARRLVCRHWWRHVTLWRHTRDVTIFEVVTFGK